MNAGLLAPDMRPAAKAAAIEQIATRYTTSVRTVYRHLDGLNKGAPARKAREDRGQSRALTSEQQHFLRRLVIAPQYKGHSDSQLCRLFANAHPSCSASEATIRRALARLADELGRMGSASTPHIIEVARINQRWEIDLSRADLFVADPAVNGGFPFRPQLVVCEDSKTRSCMFAQYTPTGKRVDVGTTVFNSIIQQSPEWPQCGIPEEIGCDWGSVFAGEYFETVCTGLGIRRNMGHPYYPQDKGKVERFIGTIHNTWENTLVGFTTNDNTGDDAIDPRKFFRALGDADKPRAWIDPRFDRPLMDLAEANVRLWSWIAEVYHRRNHRTLGMAPNVAWALALRDRGRPIEIRTRQWLAMHFLPREYRTVRRGLVQLDSLQFYHPELASYEGLSIQLRYTPDDCRTVHAYHENSYIGECQLHQPLVMGSEDKQSWEAFQLIKRTNHQRTELLREIKRELLAANVVQPGLHSEMPIEQNFVMLSQPPIERDSAEDPLAGIVDVYDDGEVIPLRSAVNE